MCEVKIEFAITKISNEALKKRLKIVYKKSGR